jgi:hypothetical protein
MEMEEVEKEGEDDNDDDDDDDDEKEDGGGEGGSGTDFGILEQEDLKIGFFKHSLIVGRESED